MVVLAMDDLIAQKWGPATSPPARTPLARFHRAMGMLRILQSTRCLAPPNTPGSDSHSSYLAKLRGGVRMASHAKHNQWESRESKRRTAAEAHKLVKDGTVVLEQKDGDDAAFWQQGDMSLYTEENLAKRFKLRFEPRVLAVLQQFWDAALSSVKQLSSTTSTMGRFDGSGSAPVLGREGYAIMMRRVYRILLKTWDASDAEKTIAEDWLSDTRGADGLTREGFCDSLFELIDNWSKGTTAEEYADLALRLFSTCTVSKTVLDANGREIRQYYIWKEESQCTYDAALCGDDEEEEDEGDGVVDGSDGSGGKDQGNAGNASASGGAGGDTPAERVEALRAMKKKRAAVVKVQRDVRRTLAQKETKKRLKAVKTIQSRARRRNVPAPTSGDQPSAAPKHFRCGSSVWDVIAPDTTPGGKCGQRMPGEKRPGSQRWRDTSPTREEEPCEVNLDGELPQRNSNFIDSNWLTWLYTPPTPTTVPRPASPAQRPASRGAADGVVTRRMMHQARETPRPFDGATGRSALFGEGVHRLAALEAAPPIRKRVLYAPGRPRPHWQVQRSPLRSSESTSSILEALASSPQQLRSPVHERLRSPALTLGHGSSSMLTSMSRPGTPSRWMNGRNGTWVMAEDVKPRQPRAFLTHEQHAASAPSLMHRTPQQLDPLPDYEWRLRVVRRA